MAAKRATMITRTPATCPMRLAFVDGLRRHGWKVELSTVVTGMPDLLVLWSVRNQEAIAEQRRRGGDICILERGYIGDRFAWSSVSFGGELNGRAEFRGVRGDASRFERHFGHLMQPWTERDGYALMLGQVPRDMSLATVGGDLGRWYMTTADALRAKGYDVRFRPHPVAVGRGSVLPVSGAPEISGSLSAALSGASVCVTFNSNAAVDAVLAGVPTITTDPGAMAWPVTAHSLDDEQIRPDRVAWAAELAWKQWTVDELASGFAWDIMSASRERAVS